MSDVTYESAFVDGDDDAFTDPYAGAHDTTEGRVFTVTGADWDSVLAPAPGQDRLL